MSGIESQQTCVHTNLGQHFLPCDESSSVVLFKKAVCFCDLIASIFHIINYINNLFIILTRFLLVYIFTNREDWYVRKLRTYEIRIIMPSTDTSSQLEESHIRDLSSQLYLTVTFVKYKFHIHSHFDESKLFISSSHRQIYLPSPQPHFWQCNLFQTHLIIDDYNGIELT